MKYSLLVIGIVVAAGAATLSRYGSLDPCVWMKTDLAEQSLVLQAKVRAQLLLAGIGEPGAYDCLTTWWEIRAEEVLEGS